MPTLHILQFSTFNCLQHCTYAIHLSTFNCLHQCTDTLHLSTFHCFRHCTHSSLFFYPSIVAVHMHYIFQPAIVFITVHMHQPSTVFPITILMALAVFCVTNSHSAPHHPHHQHTALCLADICYLCNQRCGAKGGG